MKDKTDLVNGFIPFTNEIFDNIDIILLEYNCICLIMNSSYLTIDKKMEMIEILTDREFNNLNQILEIWFRLNE